MNVLVDLALSLVVLGCVVDLAVCVAGRQTIGGALRAEALIGAMALGNLLALLGLILAIVRNPDVVSIALIAVGAVLTFVCRRYARAPGSRRL